MRAAFLLYAVGSSGYSQPGCRDNAWGRNKARRAEHSGAGTKLSMVPAKALRWYQALDERDGQNKLGPSIAWFNGL